MSDPVKPSPATATAGLKPPTPAAVVVANPAKPVEPVKPVAAVSPAGSAPALFGGHRGGAKKRKDGLVAGSPEAIAANKAKDAARKRLERAEKKAAALPPPLPAAIAASEDSLPALVAGQPAVVSPVAPVAAIAAPLFVAWTEKLLQKPVQLLTKIVDRFRCWSLMQRIRKLKLTKEQEQSIESDLRWKGEAVADFNVALTNCLTIEFNRRQVRGAENAHWIDVAMSGGELVLAHLNTLDTLEKMIAANAAARSTSDPTKPKPN